MYARNGRLTDWCHTCLCRVISSAYCMPKACYHYCLQFYHPVTWYLLSSEHYHYENIDILLLALKLSSTHIKAKHQRCSAHFVIVCYFFEFLNSVFRSGSLSNLLIFKRYYYNRIEEMNVTLSFIMDELSQWLTVHCLEACVSINDYRQLCLFLCHF